VAVLALCPVVAALAPAPGVPVSHIRTLIGAERSLGLFFEPSLHRRQRASP
jgi:hypothetical protein